MKEVLLGFDCLYMTINVEHTLLMKILITVLLVIVILHGIMKIVAIRREWNERELLIRISIVEFVYAFGRIVCTIIYFYNSGDIITSIGLIVVPIVLIVLRVYQIFIKNDSNSRFKKKG